MHFGSVTRSQVVLLGGYLGRLVIALAVTAVVGRSGSDAFAFFTLVGTMFYMVHLLFDLGTGSVVVREITRHPERERPLLEGMMGWRRLSGCVAAAVIFVWALSEEDQGRRIVLFCAAAALTVMAPGALSPAFLVRQVQGGLEAGRFAGQALVLVGSIAFRILGVAGPFFGLLIVMRELLVVVWVRLLAASLLRHKLRPGIRGKGLGTFMAMAWIPAAAAVFQSVYFQIDVFFVLSLRGEEELASYAAAFRPVRSLLVLPGLFMFPLLPVLTAAARSERALYSNLIRNAAFLLLGVGALAGTGGALLARDLLQALYGGRYLDGVHDAVPALRWLSLAFALVCGTSAFHTALLADGRERLLLRLALLGVGINVAGNLLLVPAYGFTAAAFTTALTVFVVGAGCGVALLRRVEARGLDLSKLAVLLPAGGMALVLPLLSGPPALRITFGVALGIVGMLALFTSPASRSFRRALAEQSPGLYSG